MKKGLWERFKYVVHHTLSESLNIERTIDFNDDKFNKVIYRIEFSTLMQFDKTFNVLIRWFRMKYKQAAKER